MTPASNSSPPNSDCNDNVALSYEYIEKSLKEVQDINNNTNTQLGLLIGFNFTFIRFFLNELPTAIVNNDHLPCNSCLILKISAYGLSFSSIIFCFWGLYKTIKYYIIPPNLLIENCDTVSSQELRLAIIDTFQDKLEHFKELIQQKKEILNRSIILLLISGSMAIADEIIVSIFY